MEESRKANLRLFYDRFRSGIHGIYSPITEGNLAIIVGQYEASQPEATIFLEKVAALQRNPLRNEHINEYVDLLQDYLFASKRVTFKADVIVSDIEQLSRDALAAKLPPEQNSKFKAWIAKLLPLSSSSASSSSSNSSSSWTQTAPSAAAASSSQQDPYTIVLPLAKSSTNSTDSEDDNAPIVLESSISGTIGETFNIVLPLANPPNSQSAQNSSSFGGFGDGSQNPIGDAMRQRPVAYHLPKEDATKKKIVRLPRKQKPQFDNDLDAIPDHVDNVVVEQGIQASLEYAKEAVIGGRYGERSKRLFEKKHDKRALVAYLSYLHFLQHNTQPAVDPFDDKGAIRDSKWLNRECLRDLQSQNTGLAGYESRKSLVTHFAAFSSRSAHHSIDY